MSSKFTVILGALAFTTLAGCADTSGSKAQNAAAATPAPTASSQVSQPAVAPAPTLQNSMAKLAAAADGTVAEFDKQSTELSAEARATIANISESAVQAQHVEVTGYCDRHDDEKNAKQIALARAVGVRSELIKHGVPAKIIRTKYVTTEARQAVTVVLK
jgi:outer membrane protein OmpA-like peptidoglycan-associated protein